MKNEETKNQALNKTDVSNSVLELKHLAPYLPYRLKGIAQYENYTGEIEEIISLRVGEIETNFDSITYDSFKPILRPLSDFIEEIECNGQKFIPVEILFSVENDELQDFKDFGKIPEYWQDAVKIKPKWYDYYQVEFLFEWHFDVFGLIEKGLAIDINTLNK